MPCDCCCVALRITPVQRAAARAAVAGRAATGAGGNAADTAEGEWSCILMWLGSYQSSWSVGNHCAGGDGAEAAEGGLGALGCGDLGGSWGMASWAVSAGADAAEVAQQKSRKAGTWLAAAELVHPCNSIQLADVQQGCIEPCWCDRKSTRLNSSHITISYAVFCLKKKKLKKY